MLALLLSRGGLALMAALAIAGVISVQTLRLAHAKHDLAGARSALRAETDMAGQLRTSVTTSEQRRDTEYRAAAASLSAAESACAVRVAEAHRSADRIRTLVEKPHATDPKTGCPVRALLRAGELRDAIRPRS